MIEERPYPGPGFCLNLSKKRYYILFVSRDDDGTLNKVPVPMHYAYGFVAAAVIGLFTITGLAGSYSRMLIKMSRFNEVRQDRDLARADNAHLTQALHEKDVQAASLGSLASEVSAIYGFTASKLSMVRGPKSGAKSSGKQAAVLAATAPLAAGSSDAGSTDATMTDESYFKSLDTFYALRTSAMSGTAAQALAGPGFEHSSLLGGIQRSADDAELEYSHFVAGNGRDFEQLRAA